MLLDKDTSNAFRSWFAFAAIIAGAFVFMALLNPPSKQAYNPQKAYASGEISADMFVPPPKCRPRKKRESGKYRKANRRVASQSERLGGAMGDC